MSILSDVRLKQKIVSMLQDIVGQEHVLTQEEHIEPYSHDETMGFRYTPDVVVRVGSTPEVSDVLRLSQLYGIPVTPRGLGTGLSGGAVPVHGGIVLSLERMNRVIEIDEDNMMAVVEPGLVTGELHRAVEEMGLFYPPDPASLESCSIGGNVAEGSGGPRAVRYGTTKDYVCGLEAVVPSGETIFTGGKVVKDVTGYNLTQLLIGSEGTLAVFTKIIVRLIPKPRMNVDLLVPFSRLSDAARGVFSILQQRIVPSAIEFMDRAAIELASRYLRRRIPFDNASAHVIIQLDGDRKEDLERRMDIVGDVCNRFGAMDILVAEQKESQNRLWEARRCIFEAANRVGGTYETMDVVVPRSLIAALVDKVYSIAEQFRLDPLCVGHVGDGNVHVLFFKRDDTQGDEWAGKIRDATRDLYSSVVGMGGKITAEHGIGLTRKPYLSLDVDKTGMSIMKGIKHTFDPKGLLNPGKIFDM